MSAKSRLSNFLVAAIFALLTFGVWAYINKPKMEPEWPEGKFGGGFAVSPYRNGKSPMNNDWPTVDEIDQDLAVLEDRAIAVRFYTSVGPFAEAPRLAANRHMNVTMGAWLDKRLDNNELELEAAVKAANENDNVKRIIIGNEVILRGDLTVDELCNYLNRAREMTYKPVSTAEPWNVWEANPKLAECVNVITVHMLPYWEGIPVDQAVDHVVLRMNEMKKTFPKFAGKPDDLIIGEVGWPSEGRTFRSAVASASNEAMFLRRFLERAKKERYVFYIMEAFDQPWKSDAGERGVGAYWGVYNAERQPKFEFTHPIVYMPEWHTLAVISVVIAALMLSLFFFNSSNLRNRGRTFLAIVVYSIAALTVWIVYDYSQQYLTITTVVVGLFLIIGMLGVIAVLLAEAHEWAEAHWVTAHGRAESLSHKDHPNYFPKVSVHVPAYNEPPEMLKETLDALAQLDYPNFEVLVIDNNTRDDVVWKPVEAHCATLGERFRFFHVSPLAGFKAGALNFALRNTANDAEIIAVIDSDYKVDRDWLRDMVPSFAEPSMGIVQSPQDYRDEDENAFKAMCYAEYKGFFHIGMITRNERNAIIQHGTMTMIRRTVLEEVGAWAEWCITEDAELGLKVFEKGYQAHYLPRSYGRGLMPDTFIDFKKQRFRWAYGAMQILRAHTSTLFSRNNGLTAGQRYHFLAGWLPWVADGFNLVFTAGAILWSIAMMLDIREIQPPLMTFSYLPLTLFAFKIMKLIHLYVTRVGANVRQTIAAAVAGLALSHTIGIAVLKGLVTKNEPFFRTPKMAKPHGFMVALASAREEATLMLALWACAFGVVWVTRHTPNLGSGPDLTIWIIVLLIQSTPYFAALLISLASAFKLPATLLGRERQLFSHDQVRLNDAKARALQQSQNPT
jgi:cellulose synthase/poly-beta-1,6-N-acetylglucosamine synthase-like glycosyltransferase/exo-beta-1,3-glucanase (GH17 family)